MLLLSILYALIGISILIFVHELGHYLAAKRVGVRVERFAIGFDPPIRGKNLRLLSFKRGDTEYVLGAVPFGGYVKLAGGEMMLDPDHKPAPDELPGKSVGARSLVFVAGSVMNILFAFLCFMAAFTLGVPFTDPTIGTLVPGSPGWRAGLLSGDRIVAIGGDKITSFEDIKLSIALARSNESLGIEVERETQPGRVERITVPVTPRWDQEQGFNVVGLGPVLSDEAVEDPDPKSAVGLAGLKLGDRLVGFQLGDKRLPPLHINSLFEALNDYSLLRPGDACSLVVLRDGKEHVLTLKPQKDPDQKAVSELGIRGATLIACTGLIRDILPSSGAKRMLRLQDRVFAIDGDASPSLHWSKVLERAGSNAQLSLSVRSPDGTERTETVSSADFLGWCLRGEIRWDEHRARIGELTPDVPLARAGLQKGDLITHAGGEPLYSPERIEEDLPATPAGAVPLRVLRDGKPVEIQTALRDLIEAKGVTWNTMTEIKAVAPGSPADVAGIVPGSRLLRAGGKALHSWKDIVEVVSSKSPGDSVEITWLTPGGEERSQNVVVKLEPYESIHQSLPLQYAETIRKVSPLASFGAGAERTMVSAKQIFLTLRSLVRRDVSPKNLSGPLGITHLLTVVADRSSWSRLIYILGLISINLGLFNLLPFPILDGGHLTFLAIEKIKGSPVSAKVQEWSMNVALLAILFLAVFVTFNDFKRLLP